MRELGKQSFGADCGYQQMLPLIPPGVPCKWAHSTIEGYFDLMMGILVVSVLIVEHESADRNADASGSNLGKKRNDSMTEESALVLRQITSDREDSDTAVGK